MLTCNRNRRNRLFYLGEEARGSYARAAKVHPDSRQPHGDMPHCVGAAPTGKSEREEYVIFIKVEGNNIGSFIVDTKKLPNMSKIPVSRVLEGDTSGLGLGLVD